MNLFINPFTSSNPERQSELSLCKGINYEIFNIYELGGRPTFQEIFKLANKYIKDEDISVFANLDTYFDYTIHLAEKIKSDECYALSVWDFFEGKIELRNRRDSQDAWIFRGKIRDVNADFPLGRMGADNRLAFELIQAGYNVSNPSKSIRAFHVHQGAKNYEGLERNKNTVVPEPYYFLTPDFI